MIFSNSKNSPAIFSRHLLGSLSLISRFSVLNAGRFSQFCMSHESVLHNETLQTRRGLNCYVHGQELSNGWDFCTVAWFGAFLYSVNYVLNKRWLASSQVGGICGTTRQEVESGKWEQEYSGKKEALPIILPRPPKRQDVTCPAEKGTESCG